VLPRFISYWCNLLSGRAKEQAVRTFVDPEQNVVLEIPSKDTRGGDEDEDMAGRIRRGPDFCLLRIHP